MKLISETFNLNDSVTNSNVMVNITVPISMELPNSISELEVELKVE